MRKPLGKQKALWQGMGMVMMEEGEGRGGIGEKQTCIFIFCLRVKNIRKSVALKNSTLDE